MGTWSHSTKLLHSFWSLSSGTVSQIVPEGRLIWSFQKLLPCPRFCNCNMSKTKGCLLQHPPSASVREHRDLSHLRSSVVHMTTTSGLLLPSPSDLCQVLADLCLRVLRYCSYRMAGSLECPCPGGKGRQVMLCFIALPHLSVSSLFVIFLLSTNTPFDIFLPIWGKEGSWLFVGQRLNETHTGTSTCQTQMWIFSDIII